MLYFILAIVLSIFFTILVKKFALQLKIVDKPDNKRKKHQNKVPLLGGVAIFLSFWLVVAILRILEPHFFGQNFQTDQLLAIFFASIILVILGIWDDIKNLSPLLRIVITALAVLVAIIGGISLTGVTNPFGGIIRLDFWEVTLGSLGTIVLVADILVFMWLMGMIYTAKILDGLDGLTTGIVLIGAVMIFALSSTSAFYQPDTARLALILAGVAFGFLFFNFNPAKIFLGESGGLFLGFMLGVLAVIAGGKIATALLVMLIPILDLFSVIYRRWKKNIPIYHGDRRHLHFRLIDLGIPQPVAVIILYLLSLIFGLSTLVFTGSYKLVVILVLLILFFSGQWYIRYREKIKKI